MLIDPREAFRAAVWTAVVGFTILFVVGLTMARAETLKPHVCYSQPWPFVCAGTETGIASWYSGGGTACGDRYVPPMSAAHRSLPCGTRVRVTTQAGRSIVVTIKDRGPFLRGRIIDLSRDAAEALGIIAAGVARVTVERQ